MRFFTALNCACGGGWSPAVVPADRRVVCKGEKARWPSLIAAERHDLLTEGFRETTAAFRSALLRSLLSESVEFHTPLYVKTRRGADRVTALLASAIDNFRDFRYYSEWALTTRTTTTTTTTTTAGSDGNKEEEVKLCLEFGAAVETAAVDTAAAAEGDDGTNGKKTTTKKKLGLKGVDLITLAREADGQLRIVRFEVMLRPVNALARFGELQAVGVPKWEERLARERAAASTSSSSKL
ncbi:hypothetical protein DFJ73DRAFT_921077 [Zopfochytrium polystomum]|nr:hypothetical protein DFJ73DRAFT_921077 [Zopfochytrium polystomum]